VREPDGSTPDAALIPDDAAADASTDASPDAAVDAPVDAAPPAIELSWATMIDGGFVREVTGVAVDATGAIYVIGDYMGVVTFGTDPGLEAATPPLNGTSSGFVARFDAGGTIDWVRSVPWAFPRVLIVDGTDVVVGGHFLEDVSFGAGTPEEVELSVETWGCYVASYHADGSLGWARLVADTTAFDHGDLMLTAMARGPDGQLLVAGRMRGISTIGPATPSPVTFPQTFPPHLWVAAFDGDGRVIWAKRVAGTSNSLSRHSFTSLVPMADGGAIVAGVTNGTTTFGEGETNEVSFVGNSAGTSTIARYGADGTLVWARQATSGTASVVKALVDGLDDDVVACGWFDGDVVFDEGEPSAITMSAAKPDLFLLRIAEADGHVVWGREDGRDTGDEVCNDLEILPAGDLFVAGTVNGNAGLGVGLDTETPLPAIGSNDMMVARYAADGNLVVAQQAVGNGDERFIVAALDGDRVVVAGSFSGQVTFGAGTPEETTLMRTGEGASIAIVELTP
jgi:hypothetical protein